MTPPIEFSEPRRSFVKKTLATSVSISFAGLIRAHGEEGGGTTNTTSSTGDGTISTTYSTGDGTITTSFSTSFSTGDGTFQTTTAAQTTAATTAAPPKPCDRSWIEKIVVAFTKRTRNEAEDQQLQKYLDDHKKWQEDFKKDKDLPEPQRPPVPEGAVDEGHDPGNNDATKAPNDDAHRSGSIFIGTMMVHTVRCQNGQKTREAKGPWPVWSGGFKVTNALEQGSDTCWPPGNYTLNTRLDLEDDGFDTNGYLGGDGGVINPAEGPQRTDMKVHDKARPKGSAGCIVFKKEYAEDDCLLHSLVEEMKIHGQCASHCPAKPQRTCDVINSGKVPFEVKYVGVTPIILKTGEAPPKAIPVEE